MANNSKDMDDDINSDLHGLEQTNSGKDGGALRRPMNAFLIFCKKHRAIVREKNPHLDNRAVTRILGELWANLPTPEKDSYLNIAKEYRDAFMKSNPDYRWHTSKKDTLPAFKAPASRPGLTATSSSLQHGHERIVPGKLADPSNMGGLGLLLMGGDNKSSSPSPRPTPAATATQQGSAHSAAPVRDEPASSKTGSSTDTANKSAALLQLAEMCTNQRQDSRSRDSNPTPLLQQTFATQMSLQARKETSSFPKAFSPSWAPNLCPSPTNEMANKLTQQPRRFPSPFANHAKIVPGLNGQERLMRAPDGNQSKFGTFRSRSADITSRTNREDVENCFISMETVSLPMAMPLMVNKMIETVLCKELANDEAEKLAKKLECTETLDDEPETPDRKGPRRASNERLPSFEDRRGSLETSNLNGQKGASVASKPALTFSQIQETLIRKAMEDSRLVNVPPKPVTSQPFISPLNVDMATKGVETSMLSRTNNCEHKPESLSKPFKPEHSVPKDQLKTEEKPSVENKALLNHGHRTIFDMLESRIKAEIKDENNDADGKTNDASLLTCNEEFKDPEGDSPKSERTTLTSQSQQGLDKLRYQIETQLTSHLMANVGLPLPNDTQLATSRGFNKIMASDLKSALSDTKTNTGVAENEKFPKPMSFNRRDETVLPPKKRGRNFVPQSDNTPSTVQQNNTKINRVTISSTANDSNNQKSSSISRNKQQTATKQLDDRSSISESNVPAANTKNCDKDAMKPASSATTTRRRRRNDVTFESNGEAASSLHQAVTSESNARSGVTSAPVNGDEAEASMTSVADEDAIEGGDDEDSGVRKSKRRNRGQKYQELVSQGLLQVGRHKRAESTSEGQDTDAATNGAVSVRRRKRTVSDSHGGDKGDLSPAKKLVRGFDLEAHLAELPACRMADMKREPVLKQPQSRARTRNRSGPSVAPPIPNGSSVKKVEVSVKSTNGSPPVKNSAQLESKDLNIAELRQSQLHSRDQSTSGHVSGSQRRKQRRCPITHLHQLPKPVEPLKTLNTALENNNNNNTAPNKAPSLLPPSQQLPAATPVTAKPVSAMPVATKLMSAKPVSATPAATKPMAAKPVAAKPVAAKPVAATVTAQPAFNLQFAALVDVAVAESENLLRQGSSKEIAVSCT